MRHRYFITIVTLLFAKLTFSQVWLHPNRGQWHDEVLYQVDLSTAQLFIDHDGFSVAMLPNMEHEHLEKNAGEMDSAYAVKAHYLGNTWSGELVESGQSAYYRNYFYGNDPTLWKSEIHSVQQTILKDFYPSIDYQLAIENEQLKYSFVVHPGANPNVIQYQIKGASKISLENGNLSYETPNGRITESAPVSWQEDKNGRKIAIPSKFELRDGLVRFAFPEGYDPTLKLVIDPSLIFSSFTGSTADNWGMTATPGPNGEAYGGGIVFAAGYPTTAGAYDVSYNGGTQNGNLSGIDIGITKFNSTGSTLLYSSYIGGAANELPMSIFASPNGDLNILGITSSTNFPVPASTYDNTFAGGPTLALDGLKFIGTDIVIIKLSSNGSSIIGSTYFGGDNYDGFNVDLLNYNYGDQYRGEIITDDQNNIYIASTTYSSDFHFSNGELLQGPQDAIIAKFSPDLQNLEWSTRFGGSSFDAAYSLDLNENDDIYVAGGTRSIDLTLDGESGNNHGGTDGFLIKLDPTNGNIEHGTFIGSIDYDQTYFVRTDRTNGVYVFGQTELMWTPSPDQYANPNSGQYISMYDENLTSITWTTSVGSGSGHPEISPTAFMVSDCYDIYISGWGGFINVQYSEAQFSSSNGFPVTPDAYQSTTNGSNFYLAVLNYNAQELVYGTYMGGLNNSYNHVDGGTSRFDRSGAVYHAVCAACGGNDNGFTSTPGAWSTTNNSSNCNMAVFKFQLGLPFSLSADQIVCPGSEVQLNATGALNYSWSPAENMDDPSSPNPTVIVDTTTVFYVEMDLNQFCSLIDSVVVDIIAEPIISLTNDTLICYNDTIEIAAELSNQDSFSWLNNEFISSTSNLVVDVWPPDSRYYTISANNECFNKTDSIYVEVNPLPSIILHTDTIICYGDTAQLSVSGGLSYEWADQENMTMIGPSAALVYPLSTMNYTVIGVDNNGCLNYDTATVQVYAIPQLTVSNDTSVCINLGGQLYAYAEGATNYLWNPPASIEDPMVNNPIIHPVEETRYTVDVTYGLGCTLKDSIDVGLNYLPSGSLPDILSVCVGASSDIEASGSDVETYNWSPATYLNTISGPVVITTPAADITYTCEFINLCGSVTEEVDVQVIAPNVSASNDTTICFGGSASLTATGAQSYFWTPANLVLPNNQATAQTSPQSDTQYIVFGTDEFGCTDSDTVHVNLYAVPEITISTDTIVCENLGGNLHVNVSGATSYQWSPSSGLDEPSSSNPFAQPTVPTLYVATATYAAGCLISGDVFVDLNYLPSGTLPDTFIVCRGTSATLHANGVHVSNYSWSPELYLNTTSGAEVVTTPLDDITYSCQFTNLCGSMSDHVLVKIRDANITALGDTTLCPGEETNLYALGGISYHWSPEALVSNPYTSMVSTQPNQPMLFTVVGIDEYGCNDVDSVFVDLYPRAVITANPDIYAIEGDENFQLYATSTTTGPYQWSPEEYLSCVVCPSPIANVDNDTTFYVMYTDENGCSTGDSVNIRFDVLIYVPNTFTPNQSDINENFKAIASNITSFEMFIFNRWGELIFQSNDINTAWDGTFEGAECQDGTYVWKIKYRDLDEISHELVGHVNLLR